MEALQALERWVEWGPYSLRLWGPCGVVYAEVFPVGPLGPHAGGEGSPELARYLEIADAWIRRGELLRACD